MIAAVLGSMAILAMAMFVCLRLIWRTGEPRVATLAGLVALLGLGSGALLVVHGNRPLGPDVPTAAALGMVAAALLALVAARAFAATFEELELAEALHWGSMQGVRALTELAAGERGGPGERLAAMLELGCERFGLEVGLVARVEDGRWTIHARRAPEDFAARGTALELGATLCRHAVAGERAVAIERVSAAPWAQPQGGDPLGLEAYLGAPVAVGGASFGTLVFASRLPREERFTASQKDLLALMAQWAGFELELLREPAAALPQRAASRPAAPAPPRAALPTPAQRRARRRGDAIAVNEVLARVERRIQDLVGPRVELVVSPAPEPLAARDLGVALEGMLLTLVGHAVEAMPRGGRLALAAARLGGDVTLSVSHTGRSADAQTLARAFDPVAGAGAPDALALSRLVRALRRGGGDVSVEVDPARGSTFTVFLPIAVPATRARAAGTNAGAGAATPPPPV